MAYPVFMAGSFIADGNGNLLAGVLDANSAPASRKAAIPFTGTYTVQADGLGSMQIQRNHPGTDELQLVAFQCRQRTAHPE